MRSPEAIIDNMLFDTLLVTDQKYTFKQRSRQARPV